MALTKLLSYQLVADIGRPKAVPFWLADTVTPANAVSYGTHLSILLDGLTGAQILSANLIIPIPLDAAVKSAPIAGSRAAIGGALSYSAADTIYRQTVWVPAFNEVAIAGDELIESHDVIQDFTDFLIADDAGAGNAHATDEYGNELVSLIASGVKVRRK